MRLADMGPSMLVAAVLAMDALPSPLPVAPPPLVGETPERQETLELTAFRARVDPEGRVTFDDRGFVKLDAVAAALGLDGLLSELGIAPSGFGVGFDLTDVFLRWHGEDPYRYEKMKLLEETFEARFARKVEHTKRLVARALHDLPRYLAAVWSQEWPLEVRKLVLFELWDECAEAGDGAEEIVTGGGQARIFIEGFIRRELPAGSAGAFSEAELARLNHLRTSDAPFDPYARVRP